MKNKTYRMIAYSLLLLPLFAKATPQDITSLCNEYQNTQIYYLNKEIRTYTESLAGYREMVIVSFSSGETFQVEVPGKQHLESQKRPLERMKDTLRAAYFTGIKVSKICVWNNKTPNSIAAIELSY
ncbi:cholera enterotoxin subunit B [Enterobacter quasiroggenkampii]|uniref:cholera enterotoxin subunit B n=1 Tax=Enterobacter TaxID=547 RepID=UPI002FFADC29